MRAYTPKIDLEKLREEAREELTALERRKEELLHLLGPMDAIARPKPDRVETFSNWTIPAAAKQLILEAGGPLTTRQILDGMWARGWRTPSQRPITVVHSGLAESPYIERIGKKWDVSKRGLETEI